MIDHMETRPDFEYTILSNSSDETEFYAVGRDPER